MKINRRLNPVFFLIILFYMSTSFAEIDNENHKVTLTPECETKSTSSVTGERDNCHSLVQCQKVPDGYVINEKAVKTSFHSGQGSEKECIVTFSELVEVADGTGIMAPTRICGQAYALSHKGHGAPKGTAHCIIETYYVKLKK